MDWARRESIQLSNCRIFSGHALTKIPIWLELTAHHLTLRAGLAALRSRPAKTFNNKEKNVMTAMSTGPAGATEKL